MITDERIASFINSFNNDYDDAITAIRKEAEEQGVPIIRREAGEFIRLLLRMKKPVNILEIGTAVGFSAIFMSRFIAEGGHITTIENYQPRIDRAKENIKLAGAEKKITLLEGDANEILPTLSDQYDLVFMDAAKGQYGSFFQKVVPLLAPEGILLCDNVLQDGDLIESHYIVERRNRTIRKSVHTQQQRQIKGTISEYEKDHYHETIEKVSVYGCPGLFQQQNGRWTLSGFQ